MKPIYEMYICNIDITNYCNIGCIYCSRHIRHVRKDQRYHMSLGDFRKALESLVDWPGQIGISGGEPTLHPEFDGICEIIRQFPRPAGKQYQLFTACGPRYEKFKEMCRGTFCCIHENPHDDMQKEICLHQPSLVSVGDVVKSKVLQEKLIDDCWVQANWAPIVNSKGAFFCEIAGAFDIILDGPGGWPVEPGWWNKTPDEFRDQRDRYCHKCGMPVPLKRQLLNDDMEWISEGLLSEFEDKGLPGTKRMRPFARTLMNREIEKNRETWDPGNYRQDLRKDKWQT